MPATVRRARSGRGFTLIEIMVALVAASILVILALSVTAQVTSTTAAQRDIADEMQTLRAASDLIAADVRSAGYLVGVLHVSKAAYAAGILSPLSVLDAQTPTATDSNPAADIIRTFSADDSVLVLVDSPTPPFNSAESDVTSVGTFTDGSLAIAINDNTGSTACGGTGAQSCILMITHVQPAALKLQHHPFSPWNTAGNHQCDNLNACWTDGHTQFMRFQARAYRIAPVTAYPEGMLQVSDSGGLSSTPDWQNLAPGFVDLQAALCLDTNGNGICDAGEWVNANAALLAQPTAGELVAARFTLVTRTQFPQPTWSGGVEPSEEDHTVPTFAPAGPNTHYMYRSFTQTVELRNGPL